MEFPTVFDLIDRLGFLRGMPSVIVLLVAAAIAVIVIDKRLAIGGLLVQYAMVGLLFVDVLDPRLAVVYVLAGLFVSAILLVTAWQVNWGRPPANLTADEAERLGLGKSFTIGPFTMPGRQLLRIIAVAVALGLALWAAGSEGIVPDTVPAGLSYMTPAIAGLLALGLAGMASSAEPFSSGMGLLIFLSGFALFFGFLDQSIAMTIALVAVQFVVAIVTSYLAQARYLPVDIPG